MNDIIKKRIFPSIEKTDHEDSDILQSLEAPDGTQIEPKEEQEEGGRRTTPHYIAQHA